VPDRPRLFSSLEQLLELLVGQEGVQLDRRHTRLPIVPRERTPETPNQALSGRRTVTRKVVRSGDDGNRLGLRGEDGNRRSLQLSPAGATKLYENGEASMARSLGERIPGRIACVREIRRERGRIVYAPTDSLRKPQGKPAVVRADWRRAD
jgi:hypothetical protein